MFFRRRSGEHSKVIVILSGATIRATRFPRSVRVLILFERIWGSPVLSTSRSVFLLAAIVAATSSIQAQSLSVYSGNGQMVLEQFLSTQPMTVIARDAAGRPVANVPITWSITSGQGSLRNPINMTDASGLASVTFLATDVPGGNSISQASITASSSMGSALFYITTTLVRPPSLPLVELLAPAAENRTLVGTGAKRRYPDLSV